MESAMGGPVKIDSRLSNKLANAAFVGCMMVVLQHVQAKCLNFSLEWWFHYVVAGYGLAAVAVPMFFCISGFLFAGRMGDRGWWLRQVRTRAKSLLIPYCFWNVLYWLVLMVFSPVDLVHGTFFDSAVRIFGLNPLSLPVFRFLWFVRCLLVFTIISPVLLVLTRGRSFILLLGGGHFC